ncbi:MAG: lipoyl synthase [Acidimicrobiales bacterium]
MSRLLRARWLGQVPYREAHALQSALFRNGREDHLLLMEHPHVYTLGIRAKMEHVLDPPGALGAECLRADRGGDVTYHGPGQLVGYPVLSLAMGTAAVPGHVWRIEQLVIDACSDLGLSSLGRVEGLPGVWVEPGGAGARKICAIGVRVSRGRTMHGFALNVNPDMSMFDRIVPCGIVGGRVTSLLQEGVAATVAEVAEVVMGRAAQLIEPGAAPVEVEVERQAVAHPSGGPGAGALRIGRPAAGGGMPPAPRPHEISTRLASRLASAGVDTASAVAFRSRKPPWLRAKATMGAEFLSLKSLVGGLGLATVCEDAGCPNIFECWADGTATFMINGQDCTRSCAFCEVATGRPAGLDPGEPARVAAAVAEMGLAHAVVTAVARDDLDDGGAGAFAATIEAIHRERPGTSVEVLVPDFKGSSKNLATVLGAGPDILNHNLETVPRLQRAVRPQASYARSLSLLSRAGTAGFTTKSGLIVGMGESAGEVVGSLADLAGIGVKIVTIGQYLRPTARHLPVARWWAPEELAEMGEVARGMGFAHVEASPLARSSYHARAGADALAGRTAGAPLAGSTLR